MDILKRLRDSGSDEGSHELQCRCFDAANEIERLRVLFRVNILRLAPETSHEEIDIVLTGEPASNEVTPHAKTDPDVRRSRLERIVGLHDLPTDNTLRSIPLAGCWYRWVNGKDWRQVKSSYGIACATYNDLGSAWTETSVFCWEPVTHNG